jgi:DNA-binding SARP family transcriptional activator
MVSSRTKTDQVALHRKTVSIRLMGGFGVYRTGSPVTLRPSVKRLVALLAVMEQTDRTDVAGQLFTELPASRAQGNLRTIMWRLSEDFPGLVVDQGGCLYVQATTIDYREVNQWSLSVVQRTAEDFVLPKNAGKDLLPTWGDPWLIDPREHLHLLQVHALETSAERFLLAGRFGEASDCALRAATLDPLRESAVKLLIEVLIRQGNVADALGRYSDFSQRLRREINAEPSLALQALVAPLFAAGCRNPQDVLARRR